LRSIKPRTREAKKSCEKWRKKSRERPGGKRNALLKKNSLTREGNLDFKSKKKKRPKMDNERSGNSQVNDAGTAQTERRREEREKKGGKGTHVFRD